MNIDDANRKKIDEKINRLEKLLASLKLNEVQKQNQILIERESKTQIASRPEHERPFEVANQDQIPWLKEAARITKTFQSTTKGHYHIYIILLGENLVPSTYALYVGMTGRTPEIRFKQHLAGYKVAPSIKRQQKIRLLSELYQHLNHMSEDEAKRLESKIADVLRNADIPVFGGH